MDTLLPGRNGDVLELDELWSFVGRKASQLWLWVALCRRTRQIVGWTLGDRSLQGACDLRASLAPDYRRCATPQRLLGCLRGGVPGQNPPLLWKRGGRNLSRRALVRHAASQDQPLGAPGVLLLQKARKTTLMPCTYLSSLTTSLFSKKQRLGNHYLQLLSLVDGTGPALLKRRSALRLAFVRRSRHHKPSTNDREDTPSYPAT